MIIYITPKLNILYERYLIINAIIVHIMYKVEIVHEFTFNIYNAF